MVTDKFVIRQQNEAMLLKAIIENNSISRAKLSKLTGLNKASVSSIANDLIEKNLVIEVGTGEASVLGGRKPVLLEFNPTSFKVLAIDIGINYINGIFTYLDGKEIKWFEKNDLKISKNNVTQLIQETIQELTENDLNSIIGLTVGIHGVVNNSNIAFTPYYNLIHFELHKRLSNLYNFPVLIENEANLVALGAYCFGIESHNLVSISIHSGIGSGIVIDGLLQKGQYGEAGEIGHSILYPGGKACPCGNKGCLEQYASSEVLYMQIMKKLGLKSLNVSQIKEEYNNGNSDIVKLLTENAFLLSIGINNISSMLNPQTIILNSPVYNAIPELMDIIHSNLSGQFSKKIKIQTSKLGKKSIVYGGIALATQRFLNINKLKFV